MEHEVLVDRATLDDLAPGATPEALVAESFRFLLERELERWRARHPDAAVHMIRPNRQIARLAGRNPLGLFDDDRAKEVYEPAYEQGLEWGERIAGSDTVPAA